MPLGQLVCVLDQGGEAVGVGSWNPRSQIRVRLYRQDDGPLDENFLEDRIRQALALREAVGINSEARRIVFGESDRLPGFVLDQYGDCLALQVSTAGAETLREPFIAAATTVLAPQRIFERSDVGERAKEGLQERKGPILGETPPSMDVSVGGELRLHVDVAKGQKTGLFLDQAANWGAVAIHAKGRKVLDLHCYTGAFGIAAAQAGAEAVTIVDSSKRAIEAARANYTLNGVAEPPEALHGDASEVMGELLREGRAFGLVILDPPPLARQAKNLSQAKNLMRKLHAQALDLLEDGGVLATFTCSQACGEDDLRETLLQVASPRCRLLWRGRLGASLDHPVVSHFPEAEYLRGLLVTKLPG